MVDEKNPWTTNYGCAYPFKAKIEDAEAKVIEFNKRVDELKIRFQKWSCEVDAARKALLVLSERNSELQKWADDIRLRLNKSVEEVVYGQCKNKKDEEKEVS